LIFIADIPRDTKVWLSLPKTGIPERVLNGEPVPVEVQKIKEQIDSAQWKQVPARDTERKELIMDKVRTPSKDVAQPVLGRTCN